MNVPNLADWIIAAATVTTAILTGTGGIAAWLTLRREKIRDLPIIERVAEWRGDYISLRLICRNRLPETLTLDRLAIRKPRTFTISPPTDSGLVPFDPDPPVRGTSSSMDTPHSVEARGTVRELARRSDTAHWAFAIWPTADWNGGPIVLELRLSSRAETLRNRRFRIKLRVPKKQVT
ncbi:MAG: hypothetical protein KF910_03725 [Brevundimonas sp.]|uniref:hypothetical protein n=1 Tax=Brevundimonas sp. TaxID=1871086 RepID=UPI0025BF3DEA|nr:hypothetical protein [Brevundimonas sp.]MBX3476689.1 hypothetical protein [Brevundimonas sp.]